LLNRIQIKEIYWAIGLQMKSSILTITEFNARIAHLLTNNVEFQCIRLRGELTGFRPAPSGHYYFQLKDQKSQVKVVMFKTAWFNNPIKKFKDGDQVIAFGNINVYVPRGEYQFIAESLEPDGTGSEQEAFEALKARLAAEGIFSRERKRSIPAFPHKIAVITSAGGAAVSDVLRTFEKRFRNLDVFIVSTLVQGNEAPAAITEAIKMANDYLKPDVLLLTRGGGSKEDLSCFNHEQVVRAVFGSKTPILVAIGHDRDSTLAEMAADVSASTPTMAAQLITPDSTELLKELIYFEQLMQSLVLRKILESTQLLDDYANYLTQTKELIFQKSYQELLSVSLLLTEWYNRNLNTTELLKELMYFEELMQSLVLRKILESMQLLDDYTGYLTQSIDLIVQKSYQELLNASLSLTEWYNRFKYYNVELSELNSILNSLSPEAILERGYTITFVNDKLADNEYIKSGDKLKTIFAGNKIVYSIVE
jgi:exodeoxyribonuclease VII large subunit